MVVGGWPTGNNRADVHCVWASKRRRRGREHLTQDQETAEVCVWPHGRQQIRLSRLGTPQGVRRLIEKRCGLRVCRLGSVDGSRPCGLKHLGALTSMPGEPRHKRYFATGTSRTGAGNRRNMLPSHPRTRVTVRNTFCLTASPLFKWEAVNIE